jgi:hypothetical protein
MIFGYLGKIAIIRYGKIYRGDKVQHAQQRGAAGVIMFSDPMEVAWDGMNSGKNPFHIPLFIYLFQASQLLMKCPGLVFSAVH